MTAIEWVVRVYALIGIVFAAIFVAKLVEQIDPAAKGSGWRFRLIILPGAAALWPLLLRKVAEAARPVRRW